MKKIQSIRSLFRHQSGQSLVETAIVAPILIFLLIGVFEVGWALRGYLVLTNISRETTRFGVRPNYLNYTERPPASLTAVERRAWVGENVGYDSMINHMFDSMSDQLNTTDTLTPALVISHLVIDTKYPCDPDDMSTCDCNQFTGSSPAAGFVADDLVLHPGVSGYEDFYKYVYDPNPTDAISYTTTFNYAQLASQLAADNNKFNCELIKRTSSATPSPNYVLITEMVYRQPQLFGFPLIANPFTNPVPMFAHTTMRMVNSRTGNDLDKIGPTCEAYPMTFSESVIQMSGGQPVVPRVYDIWDGPGGGNMGWLSWNSGSQSDVLPHLSTNSEGYLEAALAYPRLSMHDFVDAVDGSDTGLNISDNVKGNTGTINSSSINTLLQALVGQTILIPVYSSTGGSGSNGYYTISHFAKVQINEICLSSSNGCTGGSKKSINATLLGYEDEACGVDGASGSGGGGGGGGGNNPPLAANDSATVVKGGNTVDINVLGNDSDPDGNTLTITSKTDPSKGQALIVGNLIRYTSVNQTGTFTFDYTISDGNGGTDTATVTVTVTATGGGGNNPPVAGSDTATAVSDTPVTISVLTNDTDADGDTLTIQGVSPLPAHGAAAINGSELVYRSVACYVGSDSFTYTINDGDGGTATGTVNVTVTAAPNQSPVATADSASTAAATAVTVNLIGNDTDPNGINGACDTLSVTAVGSAVGGTVVNNGNGTATFTPSAGFSGAGSFTYTLSDGKGGTATGTVSITVTAPANQPPVAVNDTATVRRNQSVTINVLNNDSDPNGDTLSITAVSTPSGGTVTFTSTTITFTAPNNTTDRTFTYTISDGRGGTATATVTVDVRFF